MTISVFLSNTQMTFSEYRVRIANIIHGFAQNIAVISFSLFISWMVIYLQSARLWGAFISVQVWVLLSVALMAWGNKEYLLKAFEKSPAKIDQIWSKSFFTRLLLTVFLLTLFILLPVEVPLKGWVAVWILSRVVYQSFESLVYYKKQYYLSTAAELLGLLLLFVALFRPIQNPTLGHILKVYVMADLMKAVFMVLVYHASFKSDYFSRINLGYLSSSFPMFAYSLGMFAISKTDLICVSLFSPSLSVAKYQVLTTFFSLVQTIPGFMLYLSLKNQPDHLAEYFQTWKKRLFYFGLVTAFGSIFFIRYLMMEYFQFALPDLVYFLGIFYIIPSYLYAPTIFIMMKQRLEKQMALIFWSSAAVSLILNLALIPILSLKGALTAAGITQLLLLLFLLRFEKKKNPVGYLDPIRYCRLISPNLRKPV